MDQYIAVLIQSGRVVVPGADGDVLGELREQMVRAGGDQFTQATVNIGQGHERMVGDISEAARRVKPVDARIADRLLSWSVHRAVPDGIGTRVTRCKAASSRSRLNGDQSW